MKVAIFFALVAAAYAGNLGLAPVGYAGYAAAPVAVGHAIGVGIANTGHSVQSSTTNGIGGYAFGYNEGHATGGTFRRESGAPGVKVGSYGLRVADGRVRQVNYIADALGFRAQVATNEPGTAPSIPAHAPTNVAAAPIAPIAAAPVAVAAAPIATAHIAAAPIAHAKVAVAAAPIAAAPIGHSVSIAHAAPVAAAGVYGAPLAAGYGLGYGLGYGNALGLGYGNALGLGYGYGVGLAKAW